MENGINVYSIATQCGTSVPMIECYYSDVMVPDVEDSILGVFNPFRK